MNSPHDQFTEVFPQLYDDLYRFFAYRVPNRSDAEDLIAKTALTAWEKYPQYQATRGTLPEWVMGIAKNNLRMYWRSHRPTFALEDIESFLVHDSTRTAIDAHLLIEQILSTLTEEQKAILAMHYLDGMTYQDIALLFARPPERLRKQISRLIARLRKHYLPFFSDSYDR